MYSINRIYWAMTLQGVGPLVRLAALYLADRGALVDEDYTFSEENGPDPILNVDVSAGAAWVGCSETAFIAAVANLRSFGITIEDVRNDTLEFRMPPMTKRAAAPEPPAPERQISIYVMSAGGGHTKVGISVDPANRLYGLQCANPLMRLTLEFQQVGPATLIRHIEREAHSALAQWAISNEWFAVTSADAIAVVTELLRKAGR